MNVLLRRKGSDRALSPAQWIFSDLDGPAPADGGCSSRSAAYFEVFRYGHTGRCARLGGLPIARLNTPPIFSIIADCGDRALFVVVVAKPASDDESYAQLWADARRALDARLHDLGIRAENLKDGRFRPGLYIDEAGSPEIPVRHPRAIIAGERIDSRLFFTPANMLTPEQWVEHVRGIALPPTVVLPSPPTRPRGVVGRLVSVFQGRG